MKFVSCHGGKLQITSTATLAIHQSDIFTTGIDAIDSLLPDGGLSFGVIHEILADSAGCEGAFYAAVLAQAALKSRLALYSGDIADIQATPAAIVWADRRRVLYPPALAAMGMDLRRLIVLYPADREQEVAALADCLRCHGVCAAVGFPGAMSAVEARRLQLAAEQGHSAGILLRRCGRESRNYAAATRWLVRPVPGERLVQRWEIHLLHGHGGRDSPRVILERCHATGHVRASVPVADRQIAKAMA